MINLLANVSRIAVNNYVFILLFSYWSFSFPFVVLADEPYQCPVTHGSRHKEGSPFTGFNWYGTNKLAATAPVDGIWYTTRPGALISVKLFWWSDVFRIGMESELIVKIKSLYGNPVSPKISKTTNAYRDSLQLSGPWAMLVGIDFAEPGCWQITGRFRDESLVFVVNVLEISI